MRVTTWLESILNANRIRPSRAKRRCWQKRVLAGYDSLEDRRLLAADTLVSLSAGTLTITDITTTSNDDLTISYAASTYTISDSSLALDTAIAGATGQGTTTLTIPAAGVTNITFNTLAGDDTITVNSVQREMGEFTVLGSADDDTVNLNGDIRFSSNASLKVDLENGATSGDFDQIAFGTGANLSLSGTGAAALVASGPIALLQGSSITTVDGNLTLSANQQATPTAGDFFGIEIDNALIEATGTGVVAVSGTGGDDSSGNQHGVYVRHNGDIIGGTSGVVAITGIGGVSSGRRNTGVSVEDSGSTITSSGAAVSVNGLGGGSGENSTGVSVFNAEIFATGLAPVTVQGISSIATPDGGLLSSSIGVSIGGSNPGSRIGSEDGNLTVSGTGRGAVGSSVGINIQGGPISSTGSGVVSLDGTGSSTGIGTKNHGIRMFVGGVVSSNTGAINITATAGAGSAAFSMGVAAPVLSSSSSTVTVQADSMDIDGSAVITAGSWVHLHQTTDGTLIDVGGADVSGTLGLTDAELDRITADNVYIGNSPSGNLTVSAPISHSNDLTLWTGAAITVNDAITMATGKSLVAQILGSSQLGISLATANADIVASGSGSVNLTTARNISLASGSSITTVDGDLTLSANQQTTPTSGNFVGVDVNGGLIQSTGTGILTVEGRGGDDAGGVQRGVYVSDGGDIIGGTNGLTTVSGAGGASSGDSNWGVTVFDSGSTISSNGSDISVTGLGGGSGNSASNNGVLVFSSAQIFATGSAAVTVNGTSFATTSTSSSINPGVYVGLNARIGTVDGSLTVTGTGMGDAIGRGIMILGNGLVSATGTGSITIDGTGSDTGTGNTNYGVWLFSGGTVSSNTGAVDITATAGAGSLAFKMDSGGSLITTNAGINVIADSMDFDGASNTAGLYVWLRTRTTGTLIDLGGGDILGSTLGLTDVELDTIIVADGVYVGDASSGDLSVSAPITHGNDLNLLVTSAGITLSESITLATGKHLYGQSGSLAGIALSTASADISTSGTGSVYLTTPRNISLAPGSSITTVDGNLTVLANQQTTPSSGSFVGIEVNGGLIESTGGGVVTVDGRGGNDTGGVQRGVYVNNGGDIVGGTNGVMTVTGTGGESTGSSNFGISVYGSGSTISSNGADISVIGLGGGSGSSDSNHGVVLFSGGQVFATGAAAVTVEGTSFATTSTSSSVSFGVYVYGSNVGIGTVDGSLSVKGTGMGTAGAAGIIVWAYGLISATGTGGITLDGTGSATGTGTYNYGLWMTSGGSVSSNTGAISINAIAGAGSVGILMDGATSVSSADSITMLADEDILLSRVETTGTGQVISITSSGGSILDNGDADVDIIAPASGVVLLANGIGTSGNSLETQVANLEAVGGAGGVFISNTGDLTIGGIGAMVGVSTTDADISIDAASDITVSEDIMAGTGNVTLTATETISVFADVSTTGAGAVSLTTPRNITIESGSISTVDGNLMLSANQQATPTAGDFFGVDVNTGGLVEATGTGVVTVSGKGGDSGLTIGVYVRDGGKIIGGTSGTMFVTGKGGAGPGAGWGVYVFLVGSAITSNGASAFVTGTAVGTGFSVQGIAVASGGEISATGNGSVTLIGTGGTSGTGTENIGVWIGGAGTLSSNTGSIGILATAGAGSVAFEMDSGAPSLTSTNSNIWVEADSMAIDSSAVITSGTSVNLRQQTSGTLIDLGGADVLGTTLGLTDIELDTITAADRVYIGSTTTGNLTVSAPLTSDNNLQLPSISGGITVNDSITMATDKFFIGSTSGSAAGIILATANADIATSGTGAVNLWTPRNISLSPGSSITTVDGDLTLSANQQATPTTGSFTGVDVNNALIEATGHGVVTVSGKGGDHGVGNQHGVWIRNGGDIIGGTSGLTMITGTGGASTGDFNRGVFVFGSGSTITSNGADISVTGFGGGSGSSDFGYGVLVFGPGQIFATGSSAVTVQGTSFATTSTSSGINPGVYVGGSNSRIGTEDGNLTITGTGLGTGNFSGGILVVGGLVSATGTGSITLDGIGSSSGSGTDNYGVWMKDGGMVSSNTGAITINATAGAGSNAFKMDAGGNLITTNAGINVIADSMDFDGASNTAGLYVWLRTRTTGTLIDLGGGDILGSTLGLTDVELDTITVADGVYIGDSSSGDLSVSAPITHGNDLNLLVTSAGITVTESITLATDKHLYAQSGVPAGIVLSTASADVSTSGTGSVYLTTPRNISLSPGSSIITADGNLTLSANQQATPTAGSFTGVDVDNALIEATGTGVVRVEGKGGDDGAGSQQGVIVRNGGDIIGGTGGLTMVTGTGGASSGYSNRGVRVFDSGSTITSNGADISVTGFGGGSGSARYGDGVLVSGAGQIFATGAAAVTVQGTSFATTSTSSYSNAGVWVSNSRIGTVDGSLTVSGTGMGTATGSAGIIVWVGLISATGTGDITLDGSGSATGTGNSNYGVRMTFDGTVSSNTGAIDITAAAGAGSEAFKMDAGAPNLTTINAPINLIADSISIDPSATFIAGSGQTVTLLQQTSGLAIDLGGADVLGSKLGLTDAELDRITAGLLQIGDSNSGTVTVSAPMTQGNDFSLTTGGRIIVNESITMDVDRSFTANTTGAWRIFLATATADISTSGTGSVALTTPMDIRFASGSSITTVDGDLTLSANQQATPSAGSFVGINIGNGLVEVTGTGVLTVEGKGGNVTSSQYGVYVNAGGDIIGGTSGVMTVTGTGGAGTGSGNNGVLVTGSGSTITSNGAEVSVTGIGDGTGVNAYGVAVFSGGQIYSTGSVPVTVQGTSAATTATTNFGFGVMISGTNSRVGTFDGSLSVTGVGLGTTPRAAGIYVFDDAEISATGSGTINLNGTGSVTGKGTENYGVWQQSGGTVSSNTGAIEITAIAGSESTAFKMDTGTPNLTTTNAPIAVIADSMTIDSSAVFTAGSTQTVTLRQKTNGIAINLGGADVMGSTLGLTGDELDQITADTIKIGDANSGDIMVSASVSPAPTTALNLNTGADVVPMASGTDVNIGSATVEFEPGSDLNTVINGATVDTQYQQLGVVGQVNLTGVDLAISGSHTPVVGEQFVIVENDGGEAIVGTFNGLAEGAVIGNFLGSSLSASISYLGIDGSTGNDAVLTVFTANLPPIVVGTPVINAGTPNRSGFGTIAISFNENVNFVGPGSLRLFNHSTSSLIDTSSITPTGDGTTELTWDLSSINFPSGRYTAELVDTQVEDLGGLPLASSYSFELFALKGDVDGDGSVNFNDYFAVSANFNQPGAPYTPGDADGDGSVNFNDYFAVSAGFNGNLGADLDHDFGDAGPDTATFPTLLLPNDGARHVITGNTAFLGTLRDAESDGQPNSDATGDDAAGSADEDGISVGNLTIGSSVSVTVTASVPTTAFLNAWVDFNQDGDWDDAGEQVFTDQTLSNGSNSLSISVPGSATVGSSLARFRITESAGYSYFGLAPNGEVEDYQLSVVASKGNAGFGDKIGDGTESVLGTTLGRVGSAQPVMDLMFDSTDDEDRRWYPLNSAPAVIELAKPSADDLAPIQMLESRKSNRVAVLDHLVTKRRVIDAAFASDEIEYDWMAVEKKTRVSGPTR